MVPKWTPGLVLLSLISVLLLGHLAHGQQQTVGMAAEERVREDLGVQSDDVSDSTSQQPLLFESSGPSVGDNRKSFTTSDFSHTNSAGSKSRSVGGTGGGGDGTCSACSMAGSTGSEGKQSVVVLEHGTFDMVVPTASGGRELPIATSMDEVDAYLAVNVTKPIAVGAYVEVEVIDTSGEASKPLFQKRFDLCDALAFVKVARGDPKYVSRMALNETNPHRLFSLLIGSSRVLSIDEQTRSVLVERTTLSCPVYMKSTSPVAMAAGEYVLVPGLLSLRDALARLRVSEAPLVWSPNWLLPVPPASAQLRRDLRVVVRGYTAATSTSASTSTSTTFSSAVTGGTSDDAKDEPLFCVCFDVPGDTWTSDSTDAPLKAEPSPPPLPSSSSRSSWIKAKLTRLGRGATRRSLLLARARRAEAGLPPQAVPEEQPASSDVDSDSSTSPEQRRVLVRARQPR